MNAMVRQHYATMTRRRHAGTMQVLTSDTPTGPFTFVSNRSGSDDPFNTIAPGIANYPPGYQFADATLFQDPATLRTYVYWRTRITTGKAGPTGFRAMELTKDCKGVVPARGRAVTLTGWGVVVLLWSAHQHVRRAPHRGASHVQMSRRHRIGRHSLVAGR